MSSCCRILWGTLFQSDNLISEEIDNACHKDLRREIKRTTTLIFRGSLDVQMLGALRGDGTSPLVIATCYWR